MICQCGNTTVRSITSRDENYEVCTNCGEEQEANVTYDELEDLYYPFFN